MHCSQGGVKFPTGGIGRSPGARERFRQCRKVSRSGAMPEPTVIVRMEEDTLERPRFGDVLGLFAQGINSGSQGRGLAANADNP
jgi:hypothetical protein